MSAMENRTSLGRSEKAIQGREGGPCHRVVAVLSHESRTGHDVIALTCRKSQDGNSHTELTGGQDIGEMAEPPVEPALEA